MDSIDSATRFGKDKVVILGSGGARYQATTQRRSTGGIILQVLDGRVQCHVDPGPSAARDLRDWKINPKRTSYVFLTHEHNDHDCELPTIVEAMQDDMEFKSRKGTLVAPAGYLDTNKYFFRMLHRRVGLHEGETVELEPGFTVTATPARHSDAIPIVGYMFKIGAPGGEQQYTLALTADTASFDGYVSTYKGVDILVANLLRPDNIYCRGHLCTDEFIPLLREIQPRACILVHFGRRMDNEIEGNLVPQQVEKIQKAVGEKTRVIGSHDGQEIVLADAVGASSDRG